MKTVAVVQARIQSTRLPAKVLSEIHGKTMLQRVVERTAKASQIDEIVVATSNTAADAVLIEYCHHMGWHVVAGSEDDVLSRYQTAAEETSADRIVRITSDCPLIDCHVIDSVIEVSQQLDVDYACNFFPLRYFPRGLDCEVLKRETLERVNREAVEPRHREHVTLLIYDRPREKFSVGSVVAPTDHSDLRWTVDTPQDLRLVQEIYGWFGEADFDWTEVVNAYRQNPSWLSINHGTMQKVA